MPHEQGNYPFSSREKRSGMHRNAILTSKSVTDKRNLRTNGEGLINRPQKKNERERERERERTKKRERERSETLYKACMQLGRPLKNKIKKYHRPWPRSSLTEMQGGCSLRARFCARPEISPKVQFCADSKSRLDETIRNRGPRGVH